MQRTIAQRQLHAFGAGELAEGVVQCCRGKTAIELCEGIAETALRSRSALFRRFAMFKG